MYDHLPYVEFEDGSRIYFPENKLEHLKTKQYWTVSRIQRDFKLYYNGALQLLSYAQEEGVLSKEKDSYNRYEVFV